MSNFKIQRERMPFSPWLSSLRLKIISCIVCFIVLINHKAVILLEQISQRTSQSKQHKAKRSCEILPPFWTFSFHHFTVENQIDARIKIRRFESKITVKSPLFESNVIRREHNFHSKCFSVLQTCNTRTLTGLFYVTDHSSSSMSSCREVFAVVGTSSWRSKQHLKVHAAQTDLHNCVTFRKTVLNYYALWTSASHYQEVSVDILSQKGRIKTIFVGLHWRHSKHFVWQREHSTWHFVPSKVDKYLEAYAVLVHCFSDSMRYLEMSVKRRIWKFLDFFHFLGLL